MKYLQLIWFVLVCSCSSPKDSLAPVAINSGDTIHYQVAGNGDTALVFVHGWCINGGYWSQQVPSFDKRFKVITLDLGGHGSSTAHRKDWTIASFADDVESVIHALDLSKVILIGHSMGGEIILEVSNREPEKVIGFIGIDNFKDTLTRFSPKQQQEINNFFDQMRHQFKSTASDYTRSSLFPPGYADTISVNRVIHDIQQSDSVIAVSALESLMKVLPQEGRLLSALRIPVHLIVSEGPVNEAGLRFFCKKGLYINKIPGTGHYPMIEKPDYFNRQLLLVLDQIAMGQLD